MVATLAMAAVATIATCSPQKDCGSGVTCYPCLSAPPQRSKASGPPSCNNQTQIHPGTCLSNRKAVLKTKEVASSAACCDLCLNTKECVAWTFWGGSNCHAFASVGTPKQGDQCISGAASLPVPPPPPSPPSPPGPPCKDCPNILLMFTDDQDLTIGGWDGMRQTKRLVAEQGATLTRWSIHTPICAPSRSELMSGRYFHNIKNAAFSPPERLCGSGAVGHIDLDNKVYPYTYANTLRTKLGYTTGLFGKCMNGGCKNPAAMHGAFDRWFEGTSYQGGTYYDNESPSDRFEATHYHSGEAEYL